MKAIKITNPLWIGQIGHRIKEFVDKVPEGHAEGLTYETLYSYYVQSIQRGFVQNKQNGVESSELWVVFDDDGSALAFAHWNLRDLPYVGCVCMDSVYSWSKSRVPFQLLVAEFENFGVKHRATIYEISTSDRFAKYIEKIVTKKGHSFNRTGKINCVMRRRKDNA